MNEAELAEFCRRRGLYAEQLSGWRTACERANDRERLTTGRHARDTRDDRKRIREPERELARKEKALIVLRKKSRGDLGPQSGRGRMTIAADRREIVALIDEAMACVARQAAACAENGIHPETFQRWKTPDREVQEDQRPLAERPPPANKLSETKRDLIVTICNTTEFSSLPPCQIVPKLADRGRYIASESSFYRVLRERGQNSRRGRARRRSHSKPSMSFEAKGSCQVWSWDITWLPGPILGAFFYLYLIMDIYSRKIVGREVHERESAAFAARLPERAVWAEGCLACPLTLHADNGSAMKGATMKPTMERLGAIPSFSRPRVSNDNPFSKALFRTCKYVPTSPARLRSRQRTGRQATFTGFS